MAASAGFSAGFSVFFEVLLLRKPLSLAFKSESAFGAVEARYVSKYKDIKPGREHGCVLYPSPQIDVDSKARGCVDGLWRTQDRGTEEKKGSWEEELTYSWHFGRS